MSEGENIHIANENAIGFIFRSRLFLEINPDSNLRILRCIMRCQFIPEQRSFTPMGNLESPIHPFLGGDPPGHWWEHAKLQIDSNLSLGLNKRPWSCERVVLWGRLCSQAEKGRCWVCVYIYLLSVRVMAGAWASRFFCKTAGILSASLRCGDTAHISQRKRPVSIGPPSRATPGSSTPPRLMRLCTPQSERRLTNTPQPGPCTRSHTPPRGQVK